MATYFCFAGDSPDDISAMKLSIKLAISTATGILGLIAVSAVGLHEIDRIHNTTIRVADVHFPAVTQLDDIRIDFVELKAIVLEMVADSHDKENLLVLDKEFETNKAALLKSLKDYQRYGTGGGEATVRYSRLAALTAEAIHALEGVAHSVHLLDMQAADDHWHEADETGDKLYDALAVEKQSNETIVAQGRTDADESYRAALMSALLTSGLVIVLMGGIASWAYSGLVSSLKELEHKLDEIGHSLDLGARVEVSASDEMRHATEAINRLLARAHGGFNDIVEKHNEASYNARHDTLTGLPNRAQAEETLDLAIQHALHARSQVALMFIDLDGFKEVNDNLGHDAGDFLLKAIATRLKTTIRREDLIARIGGDEFLAIITGISDRGVAGKIAQKVIQQASNKVDYQGQRLQVGASVGIALYPEHGRDAASLMQAADAAMYQVKRSGKNNFAFWNEQSA